ncbi:MAG: hypothetical protein WCS73_04775 [Lentisphaeria bacterium]
MTLNDMMNGQLAPNMEKYLQVFYRGNTLQAYGVSGQQFHVIQAEIRNTQKDSSITM